MLQPPLQPPSPLAPLVYPLAMLWMYAALTFPRQIRVVPCLAAKLASLNVSPNWSNLHLMPVILPLMPSSSSRALPRNVVGTHAAFTLNIMRNAALTLRAARMVRSLPVIDVPCLTGNHRQPLQAFSDSPFAPRKQWHGQQNENWHRDTSPRSLNARVNIS